MRDAVAKYFYADEPDIDDVTDEESVSHISSSSTFERIITTCRAILSTLPWISKRCRCSENNRQNCSNSFLFDA